MGFLQDNCFFCPYTPETASACDQFACGSDDMDDFFRSDAFEYAAFKMGRSYCFRMTDHPGTIVCVFTISNDSIRIYDLPRSRKDYMLKITHHQKRLNRYPGVLIGRIAVNEKFARHGIGSELLDFVKEWFADEGYRSGCRFVIVDAINDEKTRHFYEKNDFVFLFSSEQQEDLYTNPPKDEAERVLRINNPQPLQTRIMYYDLLNW